MNSGSSGANIQPSAQEFTLKVASVSFDDVFAELQTFRQENNGSLVIPVSHPSLSRIIDSLTSNYIEILVEKRWDDQMAALARYKEDNDNCHVPDDHPTLGRWIGDQRRHYKLYEERRANPLTKTRFESLKKVGIHRVPTRWDLRFEELKEFLAEHGHCDVQINYPRLGIWVLNQRFNLSEMPKERVEALDTLGFIWNQPHSRDMNRDIAWNAQYEKLKRFIRENGHPNVPKASRGLSAWVRKQRYEYNQLNKKKVSSLTRHRIEKLEMVGFQWRLRPDTIPWEERFEQLIEYEKENGDFNVPKDVPGLGSWVIYQRVQYKSFLEGKPSTVNKTKVDKLLSIGFLEEQLLEKPLGEVEMVQQPIHEVFPTQLERIDTIQQLQQHHGHIYDANDNTVEYDWAPPTYNNSSPHMDL